MPRGEQRMVPDARPVDVRTYYERAVLKEPTWRWYIPAYFYAGGLAAGSSMLAAGLSATGQAAAARRARWVALPAIAAGSVFLVADLGRPERFHHMLRVAKPSSPMSTGTWILALYAPAAGVAALTDAFGVLPGIRTLATWSAALTAPLVASYTAVLLADTAVPAWHDARSSLPAVFVSSASAAAAGAALVASALAGSDPPLAVRRLAIGASCVESAAAVAMEHGLHPAVRSAYKTGRPRALGMAAKTLALAGAAVIATAGRRRRWSAAIGGLMIAAGSACERFAVTEAGKASARDPRATIGPQRERARA
ncbi:MAG: polysulfide reductase NrfD [Acidimicrobiales bacterium]